MKTKGIIAGAVLTLLVIGGAYIFMNMGNIAKTVSEKIGTRTLGVNVSLASVDIDLKNKTVTAKGLEIDNPKGYSTPHSVTIDTIQIALDSFSKELLTFTNINTSGTHIYVDYKDGGLNLSDLHKGLNARASAHKDAPEESRLAVIIKTLRIDNAMIHPSGDFANESVKQFPMPNIYMTGIGQKTNGVLVSEAIAQILGVVTQKATEASLKQGILSGLDESALADIQSSMGISGGLLDSIQKETENMGSKLRGIFQ